MHVESGLDPQRQSCAVSEPVAAQAPDAATPQERESEGADAHRPGNSAWFAR